MMTTTTTFLLVNRFKMNKEFFKKTVLLLSSVLLNTGLAQAKEIRPMPIAEADIATVEMDQMLPLMTKMTGTIPAQWRVTWTGDPSKEARISWNTAELGKQHRVHYGKVANGKEVEKYEFHVDAYKNAKFEPNINHKQEVKDKSTIGHYHHANLKDLQPDTNYYFIIESDGNKSRQFYFKTAPTGDAEFSILNGGDSRSGHLERCRMNLRMVNLVEKNPKILALAHGGDYVSNGGLWAHWRLWFSHNELLTCKDGRVIPIIPARGNHDGHPMYNFAFDPPEYHVTKLPLDTNLVTLSSNKPGGGGQQAWLEKTMDELSSQTRWLLTMYHAPIYPGVKKTPRHKLTWAKIFDKHYVDLALEADGHIIKRTKPIRSDKEHKDGVIYIGEGGLGVKSRSVKKDLWWIEKGGQGSHVFLLDFTKQKLRLRVILKNGETWDDITIENKANLRKATK